MTACKNFAKGGKAGRVITAALVATLSVGAPVVALATTGAEGSIDMLATDAAAIGAGKVEYDKASGASFAYDGKAHGIVPTSVTPFNGEAVDDITLCPTNKADREDGEYYYFYVAIDGTSTNDYSDSEVQYTDAKGKKQDVKGTNVKTDDEFSADAINVGTYAVVVGQWDKTLNRGQGGWAGLVKDAGVFYITAQSPADAVLVEGDDVEDTTFTFDGKNFTVGDWKDEISVAIDGVLIKNTEYSASLYEAATSTAMSDSDDVVPGTKYIYKITFNNTSPYDGQSIEREFSVNPMDLSKAVVVTTVVNNTTNLVKNPDADVLIESVNEIDVTHNASSSKWGKIDSDNLALEFASAPGGSLLIGGQGKYTYTLSAPKVNDNGVEKDNPYFTGSQKIEVVYASEQATIAFGNTSLKVDDHFEVDLAADKVKYFDISDLTVTVGEDSDKYDYEDCTISVFDKDANEASLDDLKKPGEWTIKASFYDDSDEEAVIAGNASCVVKVSYDVDMTADANAFFAFDGKNVADETSAEYTGENFLDKFSIVVKTDKITFVEGTDYEIVVTNSKNEEVDAITEVGKYTITVKPISFTLNDAKVTFEVKGIDADYAKVNGTLTIPVYTTTGNVTTKTTKTFVPYTGEAINPSFSFYNYEEGKNTASENDVLVDVPASAYKVTYKYSTTKDGAYNKASEVKAVGFYEATIVDNDKDDNYNVTTKTEKFEVAKNTIFADVANDAWYAQAVIDAKDLGYMTGYAGTQIFGPTESLTRAQAVVVLYNMASGRSVDIAPGASYDKDQVYTTGFSDVDADGSNAWATYAIKWAKDTGITTGYGDGTFGVNDKITRAQFATMLARYAQLVNRYDAVEDVDAVLGDYTDAASVDEWFKDSVAWAVSEGIMGKDVTELNAAGTIERAQVAAMAVRFQPEAL